MPHLIRTRGEGLARIAGALAVLAALAARAVLHPASRGGRSLPRVFATGGARFSGCSEAARRSVSGRMACAGHGVRMPEGGTFRFPSAKGG